MEKDFQVNFDNFMNNVLDAIVDFQKQTGCRVIVIDGSVSAMRGVFSFTVAGRSAKGNLFEINSEFPTERLAME